MTIKYMRIWDINVKYLCQKHLVAEHRELHGLWNILTIHNEKGGYSRHPETLRWKGKLKALYNRHEELVKEMKRREYNHYSPLNKKFIWGSELQEIYINTIQEQREILKNKPCACFISN